MYAIGNWFNCSYCQLCSFSAVIETWFDILKEASFDRDRGEPAGFAEHELQILGSFIGTSFPFPQTCGALLV